LWNDASRQWARKDERNIHYIIMYANIFRVGQLHHNFSHDLRSKFRHAKQVTRDSGQPPNPMVPFSSLATGGGGAEKNFFTLSG